MQCVDLVGMDEDSLSLLLLLCFLWESYEPEDIGFLHLNGLSSV